MSSLIIIFKLSLPYYNIIVNLNQLIAEFEREYIGLKLPSLLRVNIT